MWGWEDGFVHFVVVLLLGVWIPGWRIRTPNWPHCWLVCLHFELFLATRFCGFSYYWTPWWWTFFPLLFGDWPNCSLCSWDQAAWRNCKLWFARVLYPCIFLKGKTIWRFWVGVPLVSYQVCTATGDWCGGCSTSHPCWYGIFPSFCCAFASLQLATSFCCECLDHRWRGWIGKNL